MLFRHCAAALGVEPAECVVIEDSIHGVEGARRAGMACVIVGRLATSSQSSPSPAENPGPRWLAVGNLSDLDPSELIAQLR